jgi:hypothetical protein
MQLSEGSVIAQRVYVRCMIHFNNKIEQNFRNNGQKWSVNVGLGVDFPEADIEDGYMVYTNEEILSCFTPVVDRILELIQSQMMAIQAQDKILEVS